MFSRRQTPITRLLANLEGRDRGQHDTLAAGAQLSQKAKAFIRHGGRARLHDKLSSQQKAYLAQGVTLSLEARTVWLCIRVAISAVRNLLRPGRANPP